MNEPVECLVQSARSGWCGRESDVDAEALRERLAGFKLPKEFRFLDDLPRTESGAVDRSKLSGL